MMIRRLMLVSLAFVLLLVLEGCAYFEDLDFQNGTDTYAYEEKMMDTRALMRTANVGVNVEYLNDGSWLPGSGSSGESQGSGVVIGSTDGHYLALTNFHVIDPKDYDEINVTVVPSMLEDESEEIEATVVASDADRDLALLRFEAGDLEIGELSLSASAFEDLERNEMLLAVGNPSAVNSIVTFGQYHGMVETDDVDFEVIYHSALIYPGNSGGALADMDGHLVGLNTWGVSGEPERNLAVPLPEILAFLEEEGYSDPGDDTEEGSSEETAYQR